MGLLSYEEPFCCIVGSVTRLYRSCSIRDTGMMIIEEKKEEKEERATQAAIAGATRVIKRKKT